MTRVPLCTVDVHPPRQRWHPRLRSKVTAPDIRFWRLVDVREWARCWPWKGTKLTKGYGRFNLFGNRKVLAHRFAYRLAIRPIPLGRCVLHSCDNPSCCNPRHLFLGTIADNAADMVAKGRQGNGRPLNRATWNPHSKLTPDYVRMARGAYAAGVPQTHIAAHLGVHSSTISRAVRGEVWGHVS